MVNTVASCAAAREKGDGNFAGSVPMSQLASPQAGDPVSVPGGIGRLPRSLPSEKKISSCFEKKNLHRKQKTAKVRKVALKCAH